MELSEEGLRSIVAHLAHMRASYGDVLEDADLVLPNGEFFPDDFSLDPAGIGQLMRRMLTYAPLSGDLEIDLAFVEAEGEAGGGGCGSGACGPGGGGAGGKAAMRANAVETPNGYGVVLDVTDVGEPKLLTTALARAAGRLVLFEAGEDVDARDEAALAELTAVACGLGPILLGGACVYKKGCGGMRRHQGTVLGVEELALAVALFVRVHDRSAGAVKKHLDVTQREAFDEALAWVDSQPKLVRALEKEPETIEDGIFQLEEKKGVFARLLARRRDDDLPTPADLAPQSKRPARSEEELRRIAETRALVDEALQDS